MLWKDIFPQTVGILPFPFSLALVSHVDKKVLTEILKLDFTHIPSKQRNSCNTFMMKN